jgi:vitellogenic carboxypeptidase-like protein
VTSGTASCPRRRGWDGLRAFQATQRAVWRTGDGELAGYVQRSGALVHVVVYGAGHLVPADNGRAAQEMIEGWVLGTGMFGSGSRGGGNGRRRAA